MKQMKTKTTNRNYIKEKYRRFNKKIVKLSIDRNNEREENIGDSGKWKSRLGRGRVKTDREGRIVGVDSMRADFSSVI